MYFSVSKSDGFTLVEILVAVVIIGLAIASLVGSAGYFSYASSVGVDMVTAEFLITELRVATSHLPVRDPQTGTEHFGLEEGSLDFYDDVDDFDGAVFSPPVDAALSSLSLLSRFTQVVTVENVSVSDFQSPVAEHGSDFVRITVRVLADGCDVSSSSWIRAVQ